MDVATTWRNPITDRLIEAGIIPANATNFELRAPAGGVVTFFIEIAATTEQYEAVRAALMMGDSAEARRITRTILVRDRNNPRSMPMVIEMPPAKDDDEEKR